MARGVEYGVVFEHMQSGRNLISTVFVLTDKGWMNPKQKKRSQTEASKPLPQSRLLGNALPNIIANLDDNVNRPPYQLPPKAYKDGKADINTPEFKRWFGKSKVDDVTCIATRHLKPICYNVKYKARLGVMVATRHLKPICYNPPVPEYNEQAVATRHLKPICYNRVRAGAEALAVATRHLKPICYNVVPPFVCDL